MKELWQKCSSNLEDGFLKSLKEKATGIISRHPEFFCLALIAIACLFFLFYGLNFYPLLDVDETRYAVMSRDLLNSFNWNNLMLNYEPFLEKPPLYFWLVAASIKALGQFSTFAVRLPIAAMAAFVTFYTYFVGKRAISRKFGVLSALILLSSVFFLILSHVAILDMVLTALMTSAIYSAFMTHYCSDKYKKFMWWYFYLFAGLGFLAKGILAIAIPVVVVFLYNLTQGKVKEIFKPVNMLPGLFIFTLLVLPWHIMMYLEYGNRFIKEYFLYHHFARFINSEHIGRERPFYYFIPVFLLGFMPWSFVFLTFVADGCKKLWAKYKAAEGNFKTKLLSLFATTNNEQKLILFASIYFVVVFLVFSSSSTKLPTYILPVFPAASLLTGYFWWVSDEREENKKVISVSTQLFAILFIITAILATIVYWMLPFELQLQVDKFRSEVVCGMYLLSIFMLLRLKTQKALSIFSAYVFSMLFIIMLGVAHIFNIVYEGGENEIVFYSAKASDGISQLITFDFAVKPSAMIEYNKKIEFVTDSDFDKLDKLLDYRPGPTFVIVKNKNLADKEYKNEIEKRLKLVESGKKYSLYAKDKWGIMKRRRILFEEDQLKALSSRRYLEARNQFKKLDQDLK